jgi:hypothetical protein
MASYGHSSRRISRDSLRVSPSEERPGWVAATHRLPSKGELVCCAEGLAEMGRVLGRTSDGSPLLELILPDRPKHPFFAAASNVLVAPA